MTSLKPTFFILISLLLASCTGMKTSATSVENEAYLEFIGDPSQYAEDLDVTIGDDYTFTAEVHTEKTGRPNGKLYSIPTGRHRVTVSYKGRVLFSKDIFVGNQETRQIHL